MAELTKVNEKATLQSNIYITEYIIAPESNVRVWVLNSSGIRVLELSEKEGEILDSTEFNVDRKRGLLFLSPELIGNLIEVEYLSDLILNPIFVYDELYRVSKELTRLAHKSISGCFVSYEPIDSQSGYIRIDNGIIMFNNETYVQLPTSIYVQNIDVDKCIAVFYYDKTFEEKTYRNTLQSAEIEISNIYYNQEGEFDFEYNAKKMNEYVMDLRGNQYIYLFNAYIVFENSSQNPFIYYYKQSRYMDLLGSSVEKFIRTG